MRPFIWGALGVCALLAAAGCGSTVTTPASAPAPEVTAAMVADAMGKSDRLKFCQARVDVGYDDEIGVKAFASSYGETMVPSAQALYDELASRC